MKSWRIRLASLFFIGAIIFSLSTPVFATVDTEEPPLEGGDYVRTEVLCVDVNAKCALCSTHKLSSWNSEQYKHLFNKEEYDSIIFEDEQSLKEAELDLKVDNRFMLDHFRFKDVTKNEDGTYSLSTGGIFYSDELPNFSKNYDDWKDPDVKYQMGYENPTGRIPADYNENIYIHPDNTYYKIAFIDYIDEAILLFTSENYNLSFEQKQGTPLFSKDDLVFRREYFLNKSTELTEADGVHYEFAELNSMLGKGVLKSEDIDALIEGSIYYHDYHQGQLTAEGAFVRDYEKIIYYKAEIDVRYKRVEGVETMEEAIAYEREQYAVDIERQKEDYENRVTILEGIATCDEIVSRLTFTDDIPIATEPGQNRVLVKATYHDENTGDSLIAYQVVTINLVSGSTVETYDPEDVTTPEDNGIQKNPAEQDSDPAETSIAPVVWIILIILIIAAIAILIVILGKKTNEQRRRDK